MKINAAWHERHPMPKNPTLEQRIAWHVEHQKQCACRAIPAKLLEATKRQSAAVPTKTKSSSRRAPKGRA